MTIMPIQIGDKVKCVVCFGSKSALKVGRTYLIIGVRQLNDHVIFIKIVDPEQQNEIVDSMHWFSYNAFEPVALSLEQQILNFFNQYFEDHTKKGMKHNIFFDWWSESKNVHIHTSAGKLIGNLILNDKGSIGNLILNDKGSIEKLIVI